MKVKPKDTPEKIEWARNEIARILDNVSPDMAIRLIVNHPIQTAAPTPVAVLHKLLDTIQATGGIITYGDGTYAPVGEPDWIDLGDVVTQAERCLNRYTIKTNG